jgi:hypothetical protein
MPEGSKGAKRPRLHISLKRGAAITVNRISIGNLKLVYLICANKRIQYANGKSPIAYIGTTAKGIERLAQSAAARSEDILRQHGVNSFEVRIVTCGTHKRVRTWHKLERGLILIKEKYGGVPYCNTVGKNIVEGDEFNYFARTRIVDVLITLEKTGVASGHVISD